MSSFCRIKLEDVEDISNLALARGLEHTILPFEGDKYADWVTVQLTNNRSRRAFENLCAENNVTVDGTQVVHLMTDTVLGGMSPKKAIDEALTKGMKRAMSNGAKFQCKECGQPVPRYPGRYPCSCPECRGELVSERQVYEAAKPVGKAQKAIMDYLDNVESVVELQDMTRHSSFRLMDFGKVEKAVEVLAKKGLINYKNNKLSKR